jgi:hypothetical protein
MSERKRTLSGFAECGNALQIQGFPRTDYGQSCPQHYPQAAEFGNEPLGLPLSIREVARLIGCSVWTVRQSYLPQGLPHLRSGPHGKLIFFRDQVIRWILQHQQKGGAKR